LGRQLKNAQADDPEVSRVLIVTAYAQPHIGGVEVVVAQQARSLAALGHKVTVVTSRFAASDPALEEVDGYTVVRVPAWNPFEQRISVPLPLWSPSGVWRLNHLIRKSDVIHVHDVYQGSSILAAILAKLHRRPLFVTQHVGIVQHDKGFVELAQKLVYSSAGRALWHWAETITIYNTIVEQFLHGHGVPAEKIRLTYNGIDTEFFSPGIPGEALRTREQYGLSPDVPIVLSVGRLVPKKGFQTLVDAAGPEYQIVHAGPGAVPDDVSGVRILGPLNRSQLRELYRASDIFAFPAIGEMLTLVMQEAMACGLPVVAATDEAYSRYDLDPAGIALVDPEPEEFRSAILDILRDPVRLGYMQKYSRWLAEERFDWSRNTAATPPPSSRPVQV
jgi:glycosyltransferase involved in cell wall biosynthesis